MMSVYGEYFYGNKISDYGLERGYVDYGTLAKAFDAVLNNDIMSRTWDLGEWEQVSGFVDNSEEIEGLQEDLEAVETIIADMEENGEEETERYSDYVSDREKIQERIEELEEEQERQPEIFQCYIVSDQGAEILEEAGEIVYYHSDLDMYVWGVTHYGTAWNYVLTGIRCNTGEL